MVEITRVIWAYPGEDANAYALSFSFKFLALFVFSSFIAL